jgi:hypothetical protein
MRKHWPGEIARWNMLRIPQASTREVIWGTSQVKDFMG